MLLHLSSIEIDYLALIQGMFSLYLSSDRYGHVPDNQVICSVAEFQAAVVAMQLGNSLNLGPRGLRCWVSILTSTATRNTKELDRFYRSAPAQHGEIVSLRSPNVGDFVLRFAGSNHIGPSSHNTSAQILLKKHRHVNQRVRIPLIPSSISGLRDVEEGISTCPQRLKSARFRGIPADIPLSTLSAGFANPECPSTRRSLLS